MRTAFTVLLITACAAAQTQQRPFVSRVWVADQGNGTYRNPVLFADYSDPDVIRAGEDFYLVASSMNAVPGLPILHSKDLVNWEILTHALPEQPPAEVYSRAQHGSGAWAPSLRYHAGEFYIFYPDPDYGIYMMKSRSAAGPWSKPLLIREAKGWIDPCPLWDDDGRAYLVNALAASRAGAKNILIVSRMSPDGTQLLDNGTLVFDGAGTDTTTEGPKFYKRNGYYYIAAPAGGVPTGYQLVLRSRSVYGPYERRVVLSNGDTKINGPHQGGWVDTQSGEFWFLHFQDRGPWGRVVHLEPMKWVDDWPVIGNNGSPVASFRKPGTGKPWPVMTPPDSDEFSGAALGPQWQWQANPKPGWALPSPAPGLLRLLCVPVPEAAKNLYDVPNLLLQKFPGPRFTATARVMFAPQTGGERAGLVVMGADYAYIALQGTGAGKMAVVSATAHAADKGGREQMTEPVAIPAGPLFLRVSVTEDAVCTFSYSTDGISFHQTGEAFQSRQDVWIGAKVGLFATRSGLAREYGYADFDWFRVE